jgi:prepilin-type N-terminal cleavage/methylation domain-containing protein/prepilin-type processing-associated H-X9-DG protein
MILSPAAKVPMVRFSASAERHGKPLRGQDTWRGGSGILTGARVFGDPASTGSAWRRRRRGFTLVELLVVIAIVAILASLLLPVLTSAKARGRSAVCISNLRQIGVAVHAYASDHEGSIPFGPEALPFTSPADFYPSTGSPTSLLSLRSGAPVGLGLLIRHYLGSTPKVVFCPGTDQPLDTDAELRKVGTSQAQGSYFYRHAGQTELFVNASGPPTHVRLENLGENRKGRPIRALAIDNLYLCPPELAAFNVKPRTNHRGKWVNILYADGHVATRKNPDERFTVDVRDYSELRDSFSKILGVLEQADDVP